MSQQNQTLAPYLGALKKAGAEIYEVGGPVRDRLMGLELKDHDYLIRHLTVRQIQEVLRIYGQVTLIGRSFGVIKFTPFQDRRVQIDFVLPRSEKSTGIGHRDFDVDFDPELPVEADLGRRDFTVNAMARELVSGKLIDPFNGQGDLKTRTLRQVFPEAFAEDPLRLMRGIQFAARFDLTVEEKTAQSMCEHAKLIATVSPERIAEELKKLMSAPAPSKGFILMQEYGLLDHILPQLGALIGIKQDKQPGDDVFMHTLRALDAARSDKSIDNVGDLDLMFAVLLHDIGKARTSRYHPEAKRVVFFGHQIASVRMARKWMEHMRTATIGVDADRVCKLIEHHMFETKAYFTDKAIRRFVSKVGPDMVFMLLDLRLADNRGGKHPSAIKGVLRLRKRIREELERKPAFGPRDLAIDGHDIMKAGVKEGPQIGKILSQLVELVLDSPELNTREQLLALVDNMSKDKNSTEANKPAGGLSEREKARKESGKTGRRRRQVGGQGKVRQST